MLFCKGSLIKGVWEEGKCVRTISISELNIKGVHNSETNKCEIF